ncbi:NADH-quinone oxidoreductase subunit C/D [Thermodesulfitimonas autotrophica]|uniref:Multifunctional fusion protein n=1 Tax=Thermodesulfitimonas autotrophica TaxID=1894989 RepID=A0A3N5AD85_9THEO|nr:NADH-quinone oxidoreductase subunit D [Thermodesulfitimonas autotrophica]RPF42513.1 NADH-quinone oxidoreductase subunit C/D [Thermodesulfitimonas autotrophica]
MKTRDAEKIKAGLSRRFGEAVTVSIDRDGVLELKVAPPQAADVLQALRDDYDFHQLHDLTAVDYIKENQITVVYRLMNLEKPDTVVVKVPVDRNQPEVATASNIWPAANWLEREVYDYFGVKFTGHPNLSRIMLWEGFEGHPFRKDFKAFDQAPPETEPHEIYLTGTSTEGPLDIREISPNGNGAPRTVLVNFGPQHPSMHGVFRAVVELDGETIVDLKPIIGYLHRGLEKIAETRTWAQVIPYTDRTDYLAAINNNQVYVMAVEKLAGIEVPLRAEIIRVILAELGRIHSHLMAIGCFGLDTGAITPFLYVWRERETIYDLLEMLSGGRLFPTYFRIGGVARDLPDEFIPRLKKFLKEMPGHIEQYNNILSGNEIFQMRLKRVGKLTKEVALKYSITGPMLRAAGVNYDVRKVDPYSLYSKFDFKVPLGKNGDAWDFYWLRVLEMWQSMRIIEQAIAYLEEVGPGPVMGKVPKVLKPPAGEAYVHIESPKGDLGCYVVSDGGPNPYRFRWRPPLFINLQSLPELVRGWKIADFIAIFAGYDAVMGEVDR